MMKSLCGSPVLRLPLPLPLPFRVPHHTAYFLSLRSTSAVTVGCCCCRSTQSRGWKMNHAQAQSVGGHEYEQEEEEEGSFVDELRVPEHWMLPSKAKEESEWLRVTLHKWLDEEYCPEDTNIEISKIAAQSFYNSLVNNDADIGIILLKMTKDLQSINYQESFHGAFSSANAAMELVMRRLEEAAV